MKYIKIPFCTAITSLSVIAPSIAQQPVERPNILWIVSEDNTLLLGCYGDRIASHKRCYKKRQYITEPSHMPLFCLSDINSPCFDGAELRRWAKNIGGNTFFVIDLMLNKRQFEQQSYKLCMAVLQLSKKYGAGQLESACKAARLASSCNYSAIKRMLYKTKPLTI